MSNLRASIFMLATALLPACGGAAALKHELGETPQERIASLEQQLRDERARNEQRDAQAERRVADVRGLLATLEPMIRGGQLEVRLIDGLVTLVVANDALFRPGSAELSAAGRELVAGITGALVALPDSGTLVWGHADAGWEAGSARAVAVVGAMVASGMSPLRVGAASSVGAVRRVTIVVTSDQTQLPGYEGLGRLLAERP